MSRNTYFLPGGYTGGREYGGRKLEIKKVFSWTVLVFLDLIFLKFLKNVCRFRPDSGSLPEVKWVNLVLSIWPPLLPVRCLFKLLAFLTGIEFTKPTRSGL